MSFVYIVEPSAMSLEHSPVRSGAAAASNGGADTVDLNYWNSLIDERAAGAFLDVTHRTMQLMRQRGGGPRFVRLSSRCVKYRRVDLRRWADERLRTSTSDTGPETDR